jgi:hypothetical protein
MLQERLRQTWGRWRLAVVFVCIGLPLSVVGWSFGSYVFVDNGDTMSERAVTWARDHHLGAVVDAVEKRRYSSPPSTRAAGTLDVRARPQTTGPRSSAKAQASGLPERPEPPAGAPGAAPASLRTPVVPALDGEGTWRVIDVVSGGPAVWATSIRPLAAYPSVVASVAELDQSELRFALFNGSEVPGGASWHRGDRVPPQLQSSLVAAFNGGFRFDNEPGGYMTEGRTVRRLIDGQATLAIDRNGRLFVGDYGRDLTNDGTWESLRQNLPLIVDGGVSRARLEPGTNWGRNFHNVIYVTRSAVCLRNDGRYAYVTVGPVDAPLLGDALVAIGCMRAIELDINGTWPTFISFRSGPAQPLTATFLDRRMGGDSRRYLTGSTKEFIAAFDVGLPATAAAIAAP